MENGHVPPQKLSQKPRFYADRNATILIAEYQKVTIILYGFGSCQYNKEKKVLCQPISWFDSGLEYEYVSNQAHGEKRILAIGLLEDVEITVIYTTRGETIRIISARRARRNERKKYWESCG